MNSFDLSEIASHFGLNEIVLDDTTPFCFKLKEKYKFTIEFNESRDIVISLQIALAKYEEEKLLVLLKNCSYLSFKKVDFSVGYAKDHMYLMCMLSEDANAREVENAILDLISQYEEFEGHKWQ